MNPSSTFDSYAAVQSEIAAAALPAGSIKFKSDDVVAIASSEDSDGSGLLALSAAGIPTEALEDGSDLLNWREIEHFYSAPSGKYYVVFSSMVPLVPDGPECLLAVVDASNGVPTCIDGDLNGISWDYSYSEKGGPIQFDDAGAIYYKGYDSNWNTVLRRNSGGVIKDLITKSWLGAWYVRGDGTVFITGSSETGTEWTRRLSPGDSIKTLVAASTSWFYEFPDRNVYIGDCQSGDICRYVSSADEVDERPWVDYRYPWEEDGPDPYHNLYDICGDDWCYLSGANKFFTVLGQEVYLENGDLWRLYPDVRKANSVVDRISLSERYLTSFILAGTDSNGVNYLTLYETGGDKETILIDEQNEIEMFTMSYVSSTNKVMFSGLRFADNEYVVGEIDLS